MAGACAVADCAGDRPALLGLHPQARRVHQHLGLVPGQRRYSVSPRAVRTTSTSPAPALPRGAAPGFRNGQHFSLLALPDISRLSAGPLPPPGPMVRNRARNPVARCAPTAKGRTGWHAESPPSVRIKRTVPGATVVFMRNGRWRLGRDGRFACPLCRRSSPGAWIRVDRHVPAGLVRLAGLGDDRGRPPCPRDPVTSRYASADRSHSSRAGVPWTTSGTTSTPGLRRVAAATSAASRFWTRSSRTRRSSRKCWMSNSNSSIMSPP